MNKVPEFCNHPHYVPHSGNTYNIVYVNSAVGWKRWKQTRVPRTTASAARGVNSSSSGGGRGRGRPLSAGPKAGPSVGRGRLSSDAEPSTKKPRPDTIEFYDDVEDDDEASNLFIRDIGVRHTPNTTTRAELIKNLALEVSQFALQRQNVGRKEGTDQGSMEPVLEPDFFFDKALTKFIPPQEMDEDTLNDAFFLVMDTVSPSYPNVQGFTDTEEGVNFIRDAERATEERRHEMIYALTSIDKIRAIDSADAEVKALRLQIKQRIEQKDKEIALIDSKIDIVNTAKEATVLAFANVEVQETAQAMLEKAIAQAQLAALEKKRKVNADKAKRKAEVDRRKADLLHGGTSASAGPAAAAAAGPAAGAASGPASGPASGAGGGGSAR